MDVGLGNRVKDDPVGIFFFKTQNLGQVPSDGLAFTVQVGCQIDVFAVFGRGLQVTDGAFAAGGDLIGRLEVVFDIDIDALGRQVANVPHRGLDLKIRAEVFVDRLGLGRRFDDYQRHITVFFCHKNSIYIIRITAFRA